MQYFWNGYIVEELTFHFIWEIIVQSSEAVESADYTCAVG